MPRPVAERVRLHRERCRNGLRSMRVLLRETEIDSLVREGHLKTERRHLKKAIEDALNVFVIDRLGVPPQEE